MNIIFLDIDGILNTGRYIVYKVENNIANGQSCHLNFDPICMKNLRILINKFDAKIVVSSTWRIHKQWQDTDLYWNAILNNFKKYNINPERIIDITPNFSFQKQRGEEIREWLQNNQHLNIENFVILDNDSDMCEFTQTKLAKCSWERGFTASIKNKAINILKNA
jgi:hypothetical protein